MLYPKLNSERNLIKLDGFWEFAKDSDDLGESENWGSGFSDSRQIAIPASWNEQYSDLYSYLGKGWYQKKIFVPNNWEDEIWLRIGSVFYKSKVWVNGNLIGEYEGAHLPFEFNITKTIKRGEKNLIVIMVDATLDPWGLPPSELNEGKEGRIGFFNSNPMVTYDFFPFAGIHRSVYLYTANSIRIEDIVVKTKLEKESAIIKCFILLSEEFSGEILLECEHIKIKSRILKSQKSMIEFEIDNPNLWDIGKPNLYNLSISLKDASIIDSYTQTFGIRTVEVKGNKLFLNGREIFLKGFGKHEDFHVIGKGLNHSLIVKDYALMKWIGANSFRTSHYPYSEEMLDYADKEGVLVIGETPFVGLSERMYNSEILTKANSIIKQMIKRDINHPSIIMWSLANEPNAISENAEEFFCSMAKTAREIDNSRPITYVAHLEPENNCGMKYFDIVCINKYFGWYIGPGRIDEMLPGFNDCLDRFYEKFKKPILVAEFGADAIAGMHSEPPLMFSEEFQADIIEKQYKLIRSKEYCIGAHIWNFADFRTAESISRVIFNRKGLFTRDRAPKLAAHRVKEMWKKNIENERK